MSQNNVIDLNSILKFFEKFPTLSSKVFVTWTLVRVQGCVRISKTGWSICFCTDVWHAVVCVWLVFLVDQTLLGRMMRRMMRTSTWWNSFKTLAQTCCSSFRLFIVSSVFLSIDSSWLPTFAATTICFVSFVFLPWCPAWWSWCWERSASPTCLRSANVLVASWRLRSLKTEPECLSCSSHLFWRIHSRCASASSHPFPVWTLPVWSPACPSLISFQL